MVALDVYVLGPLDVRVDGRAADLGTRKGRAILAALIRTAGRPVPREELIQVGWGAEAPPSAETNLRVHLWRIRRAVGEDRLATSRLGYALRLEPSEVDAQRFEALLRQALAAHPERSLGLLDEALGLWRGRAYAEFADLPLLRPEAQRLADLRLTALAHRIDTLHRLGRRTDALAAYADAIGDRLGADTSQLPTRIVTDDPALRAPQAPRTSPEARPRCLPRGIDDFTGRDLEIKRLLELVPDESAERTAPVVLAIDGMPGVGKTSLAVQVAHLLGTRYPDAHLYVDLHGHSERAPMDVSTALGALLRQLGLPGDRIPAGREERIARWRSELAGRRAIVVLDNAASTAQVLPLLPTAPANLALVTSRRHLVGLDGGHPETLSVLDPEEAVGLLGLVAGPDRIGAEPEAAAEVVRRCGYLPLAIRLAGARLAHRPAWRVATLANRLLGPSGEREGGGAPSHKRQHSPSGEREGGGAPSHKRQHSPSGEREGGGAPSHQWQVLPQLSAEQRTVSGAFALSHEQLPEGTARMFRLLGRWTGPHLDAAGAAALTGLPLAEARWLLDDLVDAHLVEEPREGQYRLHDLLREYAASLPEPAEAGALSELLDHYLHASVVGLRAINSAGLPPHVQVEPPRRPDLIDGAPGEGAPWFEREGDNLAAAVRVAESIGEDRYACQIAFVAWRFWYNAGYWDLIVDSHERGLAAARRLGYRAGVALMASGLASVHAEMDRTREAIEVLELALDQWRAIGDVSGAAATLANLARTRSNLGDFDRALEHAHESLVLRRTLDDGNALCLALAVVGHVHSQAGRYAEALIWYRRGLFLAVEVGHRTRIADAIGSLGHIRSKLGHHRPALRLLGCALALSAWFGNRAREATIHNELGCVKRELGDLRAALADHRTALRLVQALGSYHEEIIIRNDYAETVLRTGDVAAAMAEYEATLALAKARHRADQEALAEAGLARCRAALSPR